MSVRLVSVYGEQLRLPAALVNAVIIAAGRHRPWALAVQGYWTPTGSG